MIKKTLLLFLTIVLLHSAGAVAADPLTGQLSDSSAAVKLGQALPGQPAGGTAAAVSTRLQPENFTYQGAFRLPDDFNWGAQGLSYYPLGDGGKGSLLVTGHDQLPVEFGEAAIPSPVVSADWTELPVAGLLRPLTEFDGDLVETQLDPATTRGGGIEYVPRLGSQTSDKIYGTVNDWYWVTSGSFPVAWMAEMDGSNPRGLFHVGPWEPPYHGNKQGEYLFSVPRRYANQYLGGRTLLTGKSRGAFDGSMGPALFAFRPWTSENPAGDLDAVPLLWYRLLYDCAAPNVSDKSRCDYPDFTMCDDWRGASFVGADGKQAVLLLGVKGLGGNDYGAPSPGACNPYQGYHCDPLERQVVFYDVDELGQVAQGARDAWSVTPYAVWRPAQFFLRDAQGHSCGEVGGMAFDPAAKRVFLIEKGLGADNSAVVHVYTVSAADPPSEEQSRIEGCPLFPADNIWNAPVDQLPVHANSAAYVASIGPDAHVHPDFGSGEWDGGPIGIPYVAVSGSQARVPVSFTYADESDEGPYPIPPDPPIEGGSESDGDRHILIVDRDHCMLYELYAAYPQSDGSWEAGSGAIYDLNSNALRPAGWTSADAAGLPILPSLVRYEEVAAGEIKHALRFTAPQTQRAYVWPARHFASTLTAAQYPPMGQRFRLRASFDVSGFSPQVQVILKALKKYGMMLSDNGASWYLTGVPDERWDNDVLHELDRVKGSDFEAVDVSSLMIHPDSGQAKAAAGTSASLASVYLLLD